MYKKYKLKPGRHQFAPRSPAVHTNDNTGDEEAEWYLQKYPHIAQLFEAVAVEPVGQDQPDETSVKSNKICVSPDNNESVKSNEIGVIPNNNEDLFTTN